MPGLRDASDPTPHLAAWRRFEVLRRARAGEIVLELFPIAAPTPTATPARPVRIAKLRPLV